MRFFSHNKMCLRNKRLREVNLESHGLSMRKKKKRSWFSLVKSLFVTEPNSKAQKVDLSLTPFNFFQLVSVLFCVVKDLHVFFLFFLFLCLRNQSGGNGFLEGLGQRITLHLYRYHRRD